MIFDRKNEENKKTFTFRHILLISFTLSFFIPIQAMSGMLWQTTKADLKNGLQSANYYTNSEGLLVSVDYNDETPNPCYTLKCSEIAVAVYTNQVKNGPYMKANTTPFYSATSPWMNTAKTMEELYRYLSDNSSIRPGFTTQGTRNGRWFCDPDLHTYVCIINDKNEAYSRLCYILGYTLNSQETFTPFPGQSCIGPTQPNNECIVDTGSVTLDHGELFADVVNGNKTSQHVKISCTYSANAEILFISKDANDKISLNSDGSLYSTVTIDGVTGTTGKKISIPSNGATIVLESTLNAVGDITEGAFSGTGILVINNY